MKIAIPNNNNMVNQHFGMSESFIIATIENKEVVDIKEISTSEFKHQHKALSDLFISNGVTLAIVGGIGQGAIDVLTQNEIEVIRGASGEYKKVLDDYINGSLKDNGTVCSHHNH